MELFTSLDQVLEQRRRERQEDLSATIARNAARATTPETIAGTGIGNFLGALASKYLTKPVEATEEELAMEQARQGLFVPREEQRTNVTTPEGGIRTESTPIPLVDQYRDKSRRLFDFATKYGSPEAARLALQYEQAVIDMAASSQTEAQKQKDRYSRTFLGVQEANPGISNEEAALTTAALLEGRSPATAFSQESAAVPVTVSGEDIGITPQQTEEEGPGVLETAGSLASTAVDIGGDLYSKAVDSMSQAMTSLDEFFSGGGTSSNAFNFDSYLQSKGVNKAALTPEQLNALYMQGKEEYKEALKGRVREQAQGTVKNILPTK